MTGPMTTARTSEGPRLGLHASLGAMLVVAVVLRFASLGRLSLWSDEAFSVTLARQPPSVILATGDIHPPLYYLLLHFWIVTNDSEFWVRVPSAAFGVFAVIVTYAIGRLRSERLGLAAA